MKILIIINGLVPPVIDMAGLKALYVLQKAIVAQPDIDLHILTSDYFWANPDCQKWAEQQEKLFGFKIDIVNMRKWNNVLLELFVARIKFLFRAFQIIKQEEIDIIHDYSSAPIVFLFSFFYKKIMKKTVLHTLCTSNQGWLASYRFNWGIRYIDKVVCVSKHLTEKLKHCLADKYQDKVIYIPLGLDISQYCLDGSDFEQKLDIGLNKKIILFIGPLEKRKGVFVLARAATRVLQENNNVHFVFVTYGQGGLDRRHLENKQTLLEIVKRHEDGVSILEGIRDIPYFLAMADIFVLPAIASHGTLAQPLTLLEAMAAGKPIVASSVDGVIELIKNNDNGMLFNKGDARQLADKIIYVLNNPEKAVKLGQRARQEVGAFDISLVSQKIGDLYEKAFKTF